VLRRSAASLRRKTNIAMLSASALARPVDEARKAVRQGCLSVGGRPSQLQRPSTARVRDIAPAVLGKTCAADMPRRNIATFTAAATRPHPLEAERRRANKRVLASARRLSFHAPTFGADASPLRHQDTDFIEIIATAGLFPYAAGRRASLACHPPLLGLGCGRCGEVNILQPFSCKLAKRA
jgi:hypothetical protein